MDIYERVATVRDKIMERIERCMDDPEITGDLRHLLQIADLLQEVLRLQEGDKSHNNIHVALDGDVDEFAR